jgi:hypothetical protein
MAKPNRKPEQLIERRQGTFFASHTRAEHEADADHEAMPTA